jgi:hypothetical protein
MAQPGVIGGESAETGSFPYCLGGAYDPENTSVRIR